MTKKLSSKTLIRNESIAYISVKLIPRYIRLLVWVLGIDSNKTPYFKLGERIVHLHEKSGSSFTVMYLKECLRLIQKFISGDRQKCSVGIKLGITHGLPSILPKELRLHIRKCDSVEVRAILGIISIFRVLKCAPKLKLSTITEKFSGIYTMFNPMEVKVVLSNFPKFELIKPRFLMLQKAGPNKNPSAIGLPLDAYAFYRNPKMLSTYLALAELINGKELASMLQQEISFVKNWYPLKEPILAKLGFIEEAAGKVRVVAIVDGWTQSLLSGLHDSISNLLELIPQDGTRDQAKPLRQLLAKGHLALYSFDLSAATDRLPIDLQVQVLSHFIGVKAARLWKSLLVDRGYLALSKKFNVNSILHYAVGQPMGALSSFNMLALTHHFIVQLAARRAGFVGWFEEYALLGDDIVIAHTDVAKQYSLLMQDLGMEINPHKSLTSQKGVCEFAKRLVSNSYELTPIGPKNLVQAMTSHNMIPSLFLDLAGKGMNLTQGYCEERFSKLPKTFVKGRKNLAKALLWVVQGPFGFISLGTRLTSETQAVNSFNPLWLGNLLARIRFTMYKIHSREWESLMKPLLQLATKVELEWCKLDTPGFSQSPISDTRWSTDYWFKSLKNIWIKQDISWGQLPSYLAILGKYQDSVDNMWRSKPQVSLNLMAVPMHLVYQGHDVITPEFNVESPASKVISDLFEDKKVSLVSERNVSRPANTFWKEFAKVEFDRDASFGINPVEPVSEVWHIPNGGVRPNKPMKFGGGIDLSFLSKGG